MHKTPKQGGKGGYLPSAVNRPLPVSSLAFSGAQISLTATWIEVPDVTSQLNDLDQARFQSCSQHTMESHPSVGCPCRL